MNMKRKEFLMKELKGYLSALNNNIKNSKI